MLRIPSVLLAFTLLTFSVYAQAPGELRGQVMDELGGLIVGAVVTVADAGGVARTVTTNSQGSFLFSGLLPGKYRVRVEARGFSVYESADVEMKPGGRLLTVKLSVALEKQQVTVNVGTGLSTASDANANAIVLRGSQLDALTDDPDDLAAALLTLAGPSAGPNGGEIYIDNFTGGRVPPRSTIREIRINSNPFSAEYARLGYGRIEIFTKPGADTFHGQAFVNFSTQSFNSRNPFADRRAPYRFFLYGGNFSGPVVKNKASFFFDFERRDVNDNSLIKAIILDPFLNVTPFNLGVIVPQHRMTLSPRFDYQLNRHHTLVARYTYLHQSQENAGVGNFSLLSRAYNTAYTEHVVQLTETAAVNSQVVNEVRFQYSRQENRQRGDSSVPTINVLDAFTGGGAPFDLAASDGDFFELENATGFFFGRHILRTGARMRYVRINDILPLNFGGTYTFGGGIAPLLDANNQIVFETNEQTGILVPVLTQISSLERYRRTLLFTGQGFTPNEVRLRGGGPTLFSISTGNPAARVNQAEFSLYLQDQWNARPNLTISLGLRYDAQSNVHRKLNFAPRFAFAYAPTLTAKGKMDTVIRGGFGVFFDRVNESLVLQANHLNEVNAQQFVSHDPNILGLFPSLPSAEVLANSPASLTSVQLDPKLQLPYLMQGAISFERQLPLGLVFTATVISTRGLHLLRSRNINAPLPGIFLPDQPETSVRPLGDARGNIFEYESSGRFNQNQLIISLQNPASSKLSILVQYLLNKASSDTDGPDTFPVNSYDLSGEYGRSAIDMRHRLNITGVFSLKGGFSVNPFILVASGRPFNIITGRDSNRDTQFMERPALAMDINQPGVVVTRLGVFNPNPRPGEHLITRNYGTSPTFFTVNLRGSKTWSFGRAPGSTTVKKEKPGASQSTGAVGGGSILPGSNRTEFSGQVSSDKPYKLTFSIVARNILNRTNPGRSIGNLSSLLFGQSNFLAPPYGFGNAPESSAANRRIEAQLRFTF